MARNRNPHETRKKILEVSKDLFLKKGFDNTSIQDIINGLGGLTKGVIYHHFESKQEILQSIIREKNQKINLNTVLLTNVDFLTLSKLNIQAFVVQN